MRTAIGIFLVLIGGGVILYGIGSALLEFQGLYQGATENAMAMKPNAEQDASKAMIRAAIIGACGVPVFIVGSVMLKITVFQRLARGARVRGQARR